MNTVSMGGTANANVQNIINISIVFNYLKRHGPTYRAEIARHLKLSAPAVSRAVEQLMEQGYVIESGTATTESGKRVTQLSINARKGAVVAIDLLKGESKFGMYDFMGELIFTRKGRLFGESSDLGGDLVAEMEGFFRDASKEVARKGSDELMPPIKAICLGIPAAVDGDTGTVTGASLYQSLSSVNLKEALQSRFEVTCFIENDVKLAAFAENRLGQGKRHRNLVYIDINDGIGAGIILDNRIVRGADGLAGEIGYTLTTPNDLEYGAVTRGYLENRASIEALGRSAAEAVKRGVRTAITDVAGGAGATVRPRHVYEAALRGDELATTLIQRSVDLLAVATLNLVLVVNPEIVVVGGDIYEMPGVRELFIEPLAEKLRRALPFAAPVIELSSLGAEACLRGASIFAVESLLSGKYPFAVEYAKAVNE